MVAGYYKYDTSSGTVETHTTSTTASTSLIVFVTTDSNLQEAIDALQKATDAFIDKLPKEAERSEGIGHRWPVEICAKHSLAKPFYRINQLESTYG